MIILMISIHQESITITVIPSFLFFWWHNSKKYIRNTKNTAISHPQNRHDRVEVLLHVLHDAIAKLLVIERHTLRLVQRNESLLQEEEVLLLQGDGEPVDDRTQDLQQLPCTPTGRYRETNRQTETQTHKSDRHIDRQTRQTDTERVNQGYSRATEANIQTRQTDKRET